MKQIKSQVEFLKRLYLLKGTASAIAERAESWVKEDEASIPYGKRLTRSPLAQRVVRDLIYWSWDVARTLRHYVRDSQGEAITLLEDLGDRSLEGLCGGGSVGSCASDFHSLELNELGLAGRALVEIVDHVFEDLFFELPWPPTECAFDDITQYLRLVDTKLEEKLYWLGEILGDLGNVMAPDGEVATSEGDMEPSICLDQFRI